jgi:hypothetical protein
VMALLLLLFLCMRVVRPHLVVRSFRLWFVTVRFEGDWMGLGWIPNKSKSPSIPSNPPQPPYEGTSP